MLTGHRDSIDSLAYAPDGRTVATASYDHTVRLWDVRDPARPVELPTLTTHARNVKAVAFSPDSRLLASGSDDHTVRLRIGTRRPGVVTVLMEACKVSR
jgi:WD40 repeat protein